MKRDVLDSYHPVTAFVYFCAVIIASVVFIHPLASGVSLLAAFIYAVWLKGRKALKFFAALPVCIMAVTVAVNMLFVHKGLTVLFYMGDNPVTKEALIYGVCAGMMTAAVLMWFYCAGVIMTSDKFIYIFGRAMPAASLMFSMTMRFVPRLASQASRISHARKAMGCNDGKKARGGIKTVSVMTTWALENSIDTADSMKARGYGLPGRTAYSLFRWEARDIVLLVLTGVLTAAAFAGGIRFVCYPMISSGGEPWSFAAFAVVCFIPAVMDILEEIKWKYFQSAI